MEGNDNEFGPRLAGSFDLTLLFEQSVLSIAPSSLFILAASLRIAVLHRRSIYVRHGGLFWLKLACFWSLLLRRPPYLDIPKPTG